MHLPAQLTPAEFEEHVRKWLFSMGCGLADFQVNRLDTIQGSGGDYEMDGIARFTVFGGAEIVVLIECKHHRNAIKRDVIQVLEAKLRDTKAHKGMVFATSDFQSGALQYAATYNIATLLVSDAGTQYLTRSWDSRQATCPGHAIAWLCSPTDGGMSLVAVDGNRDAPLRVWMAGPSDPQ